MSDVVEDILERHNLLTRAKKVTVIDGLPRPRYYWKQLSESVRSTVEAVRRSDNEDKCVRHGLHFIRDIHHNEQLLAGLYNKITKEYVSIDSSYIHVYKSDGRKKDLVVSAVHIERLIHASHVNLYVGWNYQHRDLYVLTPDFDVLSETLAEYNLVSLTYNQSNGEIISSGPGLLTMWAFRYGARHLVPRGTVTSGLTSRDQFSIIVLEGSSLFSQKCFAVCDTAVAEFHVGDCSLSTYHRDLHPRPITAAIFFNPLKYLITGSKDGCIKIWSTDGGFGLQSVFIGHTGRVVTMALYPFGSYFISAGQDRTLRIWSLDLKDEVDSQSTDEPIEGMGSVLGEDAFFSYSGDVMKLWYINHLHHEHTTIGYGVTDLKHTTHPMFPVRSILACKDSSVRVVSPQTGDVITTLLMPLRKQMVDVVYASEEEALFAVFGNGDLVRASTTTNPCTVQGTWETHQPQKSSLCLCVYEYVMNMWGVETRSPPEQKQLQSGKLSKHQNKTLLLGGRVDGFICLYNMEDGQIEFEIEAHGKNGGVRKMVANPKFDQLISSGQDNIIRIWRVYPYAQEALSPLISFFCAHLPVHMTVMKTRLCVAFEDHGSATYSVIVHDLTNKDRFDHAPSNDHTDSITGLSCCQRLKIFASSSYDCSIKIWNVDNELLRTLTLNAVPTSMGFSSPRGDLSLGIGQHLHFIHHKKFLPRQLLFRMVCMRFAQVRPETSIIWDEKAISKMNKLDVRRLKTARAAFRFETFADKMTKEEEDEVLETQRIKEKAYSLLEAREHELMMIRDGKLTSHRKRKPSKQTRSEAFHKYINIFYHRPQIQMPDESKSIDQKMKEIEDGPSSLCEDKYVPEYQVGFFPAPRDALPPPRPSPLPPQPSDTLLDPIETHEPVLDPITAPEDILDPMIAHDSPEGVLEHPDSPSSDDAPLSMVSSTPQPSPTVPDPKKAGVYRYPPDCFLPNSVLLRLLWPKQEKRKKAYVPVGMNAEQMAKIAKLNQAFTKESEVVEMTSAGRSRGSDELEDRAFILDYSDDEEKIQNDLEDSYNGSVGLPRVEKEPETSDFMMKLKGVMEKPPSPKLTPTPPPPVLHSESSLTSRKVQSEPTRTERDTSQLSVRTESTVKLEPMKPIKKLVSKGPPPQPRLRTPPTAVPVKDLEKELGKGPSSPPPEMFPDFILRYKGQEWFEKYFPNCNENTFPKPWTVDAFVTMLLRVLRVADFQYKAGVCNALRSIHTLEGLPNTSIVRTALLGVLNNEQKMPSCQNENEKSFIEAALYLMVSLQMEDRTMWSLLMVMYLDGDEDIRLQVKNLMTNSGIQDARGLLFNEMDKWDVWNVDDKNPRKQLSKICDDWLDKWLTAFKLHIEDVIEKLKKGQELSGNVGGKTNKTTSGKGILKQQELDDPLSGSRSVTVTFDAPPDHTTIDSATYLEAINYFCEMERARAYQKKRSPKEKVPSSETITPAGPKNTVLVLPRINNRKTCLVRLGETNTSQSHPKRETSLHAEYRKMSLTSRGLAPVPGDVCGFPPAIVLPMTSIGLNPFGPEQPLHKPMYVTLKLAPKYFIAEQTVVKRPPMTALPT